MTLCECGCGAETKLASTTKNGLVHGIDRVDNTKGYTIENSRPCCFRCNQAKSSMTEQEFFDWIKAVYEVHRDSF
jgi:5-methylcytosine-specific restriction endonuclease McrA